MYTSFSMSSFSTVLILLIDLLISLHVSYFKSQIILPNQSSLIWVPLSISFASMSEFSINTFILHRLRKKFLQVIPVPISLYSASWELRQYSHRVRGTMKIPELTLAPGNQTRDLLIARPTLYLTTRDTKYVLYHVYCVYKQKFDSSLI